MLFAQNASRSCRTKQQLLRLLASSHTQQAAAAVAEGVEGRAYANDAATQHNGVADLVAGAEAESQLIGYDAAAASRPLRVHQVRDTANRTLLPQQQSHRPLTVNRTHAIFPVSLYVFFFLCS
jgi:hypothetical protein